MENVPQIVPVQWGNRPVWVNVQLPKLADCANRRRARDCSSGSPEISSLKAATSWQVAPSALAGATAASSSRARSPSRTRA